MTTTTVGTHARVAGVWQACEAIVKHDGNWSDITGPLQKSYARASGTWEVVATDLQRGLSTDTSTRSVSHFDFSAPYDTEAGMRISFDGRMLSKQGSPSYSDNKTEWMKYKNAHGLWNYFVFFNNPSHTLDTVPASLTTKKEVSATSQTFETENLVQGAETGSFTCQFGDWDAPGPAPVYLTFTLTVTAENV